MESGTLETRLRGGMESLTASERRVATALLADYPFAGLATVAELAERTAVSVPTVLRLTTKLGFSGYGEFQRSLIGELKEGYHSPITLRETHGGVGPVQGFLPRLADVTLGAVVETANALPEAEFEKVCELIGDTRRSVFLIGGRMSHMMASLLYRHLRQIRRRVYLVPETHEDWPEYLLRMSKRDVLLVFDYRRYQPDLERLARRAAKDRGAQVVAFTDKWLSPVCRHAAHILPAAVEVGTPWDTFLSIMLVIEAIINRVSEYDWDATKQRIEDWDALRTEPPGQDTDEGKTTT